MRNICNMFNLFTNTKEALDEQIFWTGRLFKVRTLPLAAKIQMKAGR